MQASSAVSVDNSKIVSNLRASAVGNSGGILITAESLSLTNGAQLQSGTLGQGNGGNMIINASDRVNFDGKGDTFSSANTSVQPGAIGKAGDIRVTTGTLSLTNGSFLTSSTLGKGDAGNITIDAHDTISFDGGSSAQSYVFGSGVGKGGDIRVTTGSLSLTKGSQLNTNVLGQGEAGNITIDARDTVNLDGIVGNAISGVQSSLLTGGVGKGGDIRVTTGSLSVTGGAELDVASDGRGSAGNITLNARDPITFEGVGKNGNGVLLSGSIFIDPRQATIRDGAKVSVNSEGTGNAGNISLLADTLTLDNGASISAQTSSSQGGNINLLLGDILLLRRGSQISTNAGTALKGGDGGNININSKFIVALPEENSNITANAYTGTGGNIQINSSAIFGIQSRPQLTDLSSITASSTLGVAGAVNINILNTDALQNSLTQLPSNIIHTNALLANSCIVRRKNQPAGTFLITGNGGLPQRPGDAVVSSYPTGTVRSVPSVGDPTKSATSTSVSRVQKISTPIVEPQGVYRLANGHLVLSRECP